MTKIYLIRHAEAEGNLYRRAQGSYESNITPLGRLQIAALAERFRNVPLDGLYSSDMVRTQSTASAITKYHPALQPKLDCRLREQSVGVWEDLPWGDLARDWPEQMALFAQDPAGFHVPGSESYTAMQQRVEEALREIAQQNEGKTVAAVAHGMVIRGFLAKLMNIPSAQIRRLPHGDNTAVHLLHYDQGVFSVEYYNDAGHLTDQTSTFSRQDWWHRPDGGAADVDNACFSPLDLSRDKALYVRCYENTWMASHGNLAGFNETVYLAMAKGHCAQDPRLAVKMTRDGKFVGLVELDKDRGVRENAGWISLIYCDSEFRRQRLGIQLLGHAVSYFRSLGCDKLRLHVSKTNENAIGFYEHCGFRALETVQGVGGDLWLMEADIRPAIWYLP